MDILSVCMYTARTWRLADHRNWGRAQLIVNVGVCLAAWPLRSNAEALFSLTTSRIWHGIDHGVLSLSMRADRELLISRFVTSGNVQFLGRSPHNTFMKNAEARFNL